MTLTLRNDPGRPGGGFALLAGPALAGVTTLTVENGFAPGQFLGEDGKWGRNPFAFPVDESAPGVLSLGPHLVDHVPTELQVELRSGEGRALGQLFWADVIPSRNPGSVTSKDVLEERRRRAEQRLADAQADGERQALAKLALEKAALETAARDKAAREQAARDFAALEAVRAETQAAAAAAAEAEATRQRDAERAKQAAAEARNSMLGIEPVAAPGRRSRLPLVAALLLLPLAAAAAFLATRPDLLDGLRRQAPAPQAAEKPAPPVAPTPAAVDCSTFGGRVAEVRDRSDADKVALGQQALQAGCGTEAFQAFDSADTEASEAAAWHLARFYDPNETAPVYRHAASVHPDYAAVYYRMWRDRSPRQARALAKICREDRDGGTSLSASCGR